MVESLDLPTPDPQYILDLLRQRHWGQSLLIVDIFCVAMFVSTPSAQICAQVLLINAASGPRVKKRKTATEFSCYRIREGARYVNDEVISPIRWATLDFLRI